MNILRKIVRAAVGTGVVVTPCTDSEKLLQLIDSLKPRKTDLVRYGPQGDGGYLLPNDLEDITACYSPGVDTISEFEKSCAEKGMSVYLADASVDQPACSHEDFYFTKKYIGSFGGESFMTLDDWVRETETAPDAELLLQMDIEGFEYEVIHSLSIKLQKQFRIMVIEFHNLHNLFNKHWFNLAARCFEKLLSTHYCVHIHPNNLAGVRRKNGIEIPCLAEFTFLRKDRLVGEEMSNTFPHPLDFDNTTNNTIVLPECWYKKSNSQ